MDHWTFLSFLFCIWRGVNLSGQRVFALHFFDFDSRKKADTLRILYGYFIDQGQVTLSHDGSDINWCGHAFRMSNIFLDNRLSLQCWITLLVLHITVSNQLYMRNLIRYIYDIFAIRNFLSTTIWYYRWDSNQQRISTLNCEAHV